jgi:hypothetical protein
MNHSLIPENQGWDYTATFATPTPGPLQNSARSIRKSLTRILRNPLALHPVDGSKPSFTSKETQTPNRKSWASSFFRRHSLVSNRLSVSTSISQETSNTFGQHHFEGVPPMPPLPEQYSSAVSNRSSTVSSISSLSILARPGTRHGEKALPKLPLALKLKGGKVVPKNEDIPETQWNTTTRIVIRNNGTDAKPSWPQ